MSVASERIAQSRGGAIYRRETLKQLLFGILFQVFPAHRFLIKTHKVRKSYESQRPIDIVTQFCVSTVGCAL